MKIEWEPAGEQLTLFSPAGSRERASHTAQQESDLEKMMTATSGRRCLERFGKFSRHGLWARTFAASLIGTGAWYSTKCRLTWKLSATKCNRLYFQLVPSTLPIGEIGFGLLRTPAAQEPGISPERLVTKDGQPAKIGELAYDKHTGRLAQVGVIQQVQMGLLPTPKAGDADFALPRTSGRPPEKSTHLATRLKYAYNNLLPTPEANNYKNGHKTVSPRIERKMEQGWTVGLNDRATLGLLPTPTAISDPKGGCTRPDAKRQNDTLAHAMHAQTNAQPGTTSQLNPQFVGEMMGFPKDWTVLPFLSGEMNP